MAECSLLKRTKALVDQEQAAAAGDGVTKDEQSRKTAMTVQSLLQAQASRTDEQQKNKSVSL